VAAEGEGYSVAVDVPFADALVSLSSDQKDRRILSTMIEVNRRLYMDERTDKRVRILKRCVMQSTS